MSTILRAAARRIGISARSPGAFACAGGAVAGIFVQAVGHQFVAQFGTSLPMATGLALALALGASIGIARAARGPESAPGSHPRRPLVVAAPIVALAAWALALPWLAAAMLAVTGRLPIEWLATRGIDLFHGVTVAVALIAAPIAWSMMFAIRGARRLADSRRSPSLRAEAFAEFGLLRAGIAGMACGFVLQVFALAPLVGVAGGAWVATGFAAAGFAGFVGMRRGRRAAALETDSDSTIAGADRVSRVPESGGVNDRSGVFVRAALAASIVCLGAMAALFGRAVRQLMPPASFVVWMEWAAVLLGVAIGWWWSDRSARQGRGRRQPAIAAGLTAACCSALLPLLFGALTDWQLALNASVESLSGLLVARTAIAVACFLPLGVAWGTAGHGLSACADDEGDSSTLRLRPFLFVAGLLAVEWLLLSWFSAGVLFAGCGWTLAGTCAVLWIGARGTRRFQWRLATIVAGAATALVAGTMFHRGYDPARSAKTLFSTEVVAAYRNGVEPDLRTVLDDGRLLGVVEGEAGTYTVWRHRGSQLQVRESGMPKAIATVDSRISPQPWSEVLLSALPLALHRRPERVLLLGMGAGATATTTLAFPVGELVCCEPDSAMISLAQRELRGGFESKLLASGSAWDDPRMRVIRIDPKLAVAGRGDPFDVILSNPDRPLSCDAQGSYTREFYARAAARLAEQGIFCQRFSHPDYGPLPVQRAAATLQSAFAHVALVEIAPGEMLLLGTNDPEGFAGDGLAARLQGPHVRRVLAELDWDWTVPLSFTVLEGDLLARFADAATVGSNTVANGRFAFSLPQEVMRWGHKGNELAQRLADVLEPGEHPPQLFDWIDEQQRTIARARWEQVLERQRILDQHPDEWWAYRLGLKRRIQQSRPMEIIQARGGDPDEPTETDRRMEYLRALGGARQSLSEASAAANPSSAEEEIARVAAFAVPYDPLVTPFLYFELAELRGRGDGPAHAADELTHRLHAVHFAIAGDRSVRNIAKALELLSRDAAAEPDPVLRGDHLNSLLQALKHRWDQRAARPLPQKAEPALADADACILAVEGALAAMDELAEAGAAPENWPARRLFLERTLLRPLRTYRSRRFQHHVHSRRQTQRLFEQSRTGEQ
ncbi:MAG: hypothetical protein WED34_01170 [Planctomycetales bacterium]